MFKFKDFHELQNKQSEQYKEYILMKLLEYCKEFGFDYYQLIGLDFKSIESFKYKGLFIEYSKDEKAICWHRDNLSIGQLIKFDESDSLTEVLHLMFVSMISRIENRKDDKIKIV